MSLKANCPACGGPVTFQVSTSLVTVCPYCRSVVGRGDRGLESLGKVADLVQTESPLDVGLKGRYEGKPFTLTGRTQYAHPAGGVWDEWYAAFADGTWGWLAEAQGRFYMTFEAPRAEGLPAYDRLALGQSIQINDVKLTVAEKNTGSVAGAAGEMPARITPGKQHPFADLSGPRGEFATLDYSDSKPTLYLGREVTLDELQIPHSKRRQFPGQEPKIQAVQLNCPHCGGALQLRAPDKSERVGCPSCGSLLDVKEGKLRLLKSLEPPSVQPILPLGSVGKYQGVEWTVIGFMQRYVTFEETNYYWEEYLLYQPRLGFRWLTRSDDHWNWVENIPPASVSVEGRHANYSGAQFSLFQQATAKVAFVVGEFYWKVQAGETVESKDYIRPPVMLSEEVTRGGGGEGEVNWSRAVYLRPDEVEGIFSLKEPLPRPTNVGPSQPFPHTGVYPTFGVLVLMALALCLFVMTTWPRRVVYEKTVTMQPLPAGQRTFHVIGEDEDKDKLSLKGHQNVEVELRPIGTPWVYISGSLTRADPPPKPGQKTRPGTNQPHEFSFVALAGEPQSVYLSSVPRGEYRLQYELSWKDPSQPATAQVRLRQGVPHGMTFVYVLLMLGAVPVLVGLYQLYFEAQRWKDSNVIGTATSATEESTDEG